MFVCVYNERLKEGYMYSVPYLFKYYNFMSSFNVRKN